LSIYPHNQRMRLNQYIAFHTKMSRRQADTLIQKGFVEINGELGEFHQTVTEDDTLRIYEKGEWKTISSSETKSQVLLMYKPIFSVTTHSDPQKRKTVFDVLPKQYSRLKPAGRLDYMSEGLLVLSSDGDLIHKLTHPSHETEKQYLVALKYILKPNQIKEMSAGMTLEDYQLNPVKIEPFKHLSDYDYLKLEPKHFWYSFTLTEGRNNQIRLMCKQFGQEVLRLVRVKHGKYQLSYDLYRKKYLVI
jgi:23S rRNA pseudouridine2605 synthase